MNRWILPFLSVPWMLACGDDPTAMVSDSDVVTPNLFEGVAATLSSGDEVVCANATDRTELGRFDERVQPVPPNSDPWLWGSGLISADFDGDGWTDLISPTEHGLQMYMGSADGAFEIHGRESDIASFDTAFGAGGSVADYDGDGDLDVYVLRIAGFPAEEWTEENRVGENRLLQNQGDGTFIDVTDEAGVSACGVHHRTGDWNCFRSMSASWGDFDRDGDLDLFVGNYGYVDESDGVRQDEMDPAEPSFLYENNGDGTFTDASDLLPDELHDGYTYAGGFLDLDNDGWLDLYTVNDFGLLWPNRVLWNNEGSLEFRPDDGSGLVRSMTGMGLGIGDLNGDGWLDLAIPLWRSNVLLLSDVQSESWVDGGFVANFTLDFDRGQEVGWGTEMADVDNDGDLDIVQQFGHVENENSVWSNPRLQPDALYLNRSGGDLGFTFDDVGAAWGVDSFGQGRGGLVADINNDGWLDLAKRDLVGPDQVFLSRCGNANWLKLELRQPETGNTYAIGARVEIEIDGVVQMRQLLSGGTSFATGRPPVVHFGLGTADAIDRLTIRWPDGQESVLNEPVEGSRTVTISRDATAP